MVDALVLGTSPFGGGGSSPLLGTNVNERSEFTVVLTYRSLDEGMVGIISISQSYPISILSGSPTSLNLVELNSCMLYCSIKILKRNRLKLSLFRVSGQLLS
jgi:hypothetical protein